MEIQHVQRLNDVDTVVVAEFFIRRFADNRVHMNRIDHLDVRMLIHDSANRSEHVVHRFAQILAAMRCEHDQPAALCPFQFRMGIVFSYRGFQRINGGIARHVDGLSPLPLFEQVLPGQLRRRKVVPGDNAHSLPVELLGVWRIDVVGTQTRLHMPDRDLQIEASQRRDKGRARIAMHQHNIRLLLFKHLTDALKNIHRHIKERLPLLHDGQIIIRYNAEGFQHLVKHLPMLPCYTNHRLDAFALLQLQHERAHLDRFRPRSKYEHHFFHHRSSFVNPSSCRAAHSARFAQLLSFRNASACCGVYFTAGFSFSRRRSCSIYVSLVS